MSETTEINKIINDNLQKMYDKYHDNFIDNYEGNPCYRGSNEIREGVEVACYNSFKEDFDYVWFLEILEEDERLQAYIDKMVLAF